jgi:hypothetical protein
LLLDLPLLLLLLVAELIFSRASARRNAHPTHPGPKTSPHRVSLGDLIDRSITRHVVDAVDRRLLLR